MSSGMLLIVYIVNADENTGSEGCCRPSLCQWCRHLLLPLLSPHGMPPLSGLQPKGDLDIIASLSESHSLPALSVNFLVCCKVQVSSIYRCKGCLASS